MLFSLRGKRRVASSGEKPRGHTRAPGWARFLLPIQVLLQEKRNPRDSQPTTSIPMDRAVPSTDLTAAARSTVFRSTSLSLAISSTCFFVTLPTFVLFGTPEPFSSFAAFLSRTEAGGVFVMNEYDRSEYTV